MEFALSISISLQFSSIISLDPIPKSTVFITSSVMLIGAVISVLVLFGSFLSSLKVFLQSSQESPEHSFIKILPRISYSTALGEMKSVSMYVPVPVNLSVHVKRNKDRNIN